LINGKINKSYLIGKASSDFSGTYMVLINPSNNKTYKQAFITHVPGLNANLNTHYNSNIYHWRNNTIYNYNANEIESVYVQFPDSTKSYSIEMKSKHPKIIMLNTKKALTKFELKSISQYMGYFNNLTFNEVVIKNINDLLYVSTITVTDTDNIKNTVHFYSDQKNTANSTSTINLFAKLDNGELVKVQAYLFGKIMPEVDYFLSN
jgi:hypothetical protein